jgi:DNA-nicking Smr family endonuclease
MRLYKSLDAEENSHSGTPAKGPIHPDDQALLDAHGMTEEQAKDFVLAFLNTYDRIRKKPPGEK